MMPGALRQHARLLRERYAGDGSRDGEAARIHADAMAARAEIMEAEANIPSPAPEEDCTLRDTYPIIGRVVRRGGSIKEIEHPWDERHVRALNRRGIDICVGVVPTTRVPEERQGSLIRIYIGTRVTRGRELCGAMASGARSKAVETTAKTGRVGERGNMWSAVKNQPISTRWRLTWREQSRR